MVNLLFWKHDQYSQFVILETWSIWLICYFWNMVNIVNLLFWKHDQYSQSLVICTIPVDQAFHPAFSVLVLLGPFAAFVYYVAYRYAFNPLSLYSFSYWSQLESIIINILIIIITNLFYFFFTFASFPRLQILVFFHWCLRYPELFNEFLETALTHQYNL